MTTGLAAAQPGTVPQVVGTQRRIGPWRRWAPAVWLACFVGSLLLLTIPISHDDQVLFRLGAGVLADGGVLYRDFWDVKQPGIYWFNEAALRLFGEGLSADSVKATGVHWLVILWLASTGLAAAVVAAIIAPYTGAWLFAPVLTLGFYVMRADVYNLGQVETLVALPILGIIGCMLAVAGRRLPVARAWFIAGLLTGVTAVLKLMLITIPGIILLIALARLGFQRGTRSVVTAILAGVAGLALVLAATVAPFIANGTFNTFIWTQFGYPTEALALIEHAPLTRLTHSILWIGSTVLLILPAAWIGGRSTLARRARHRDTPEPLTDPTATSAAAGLGLGMADRHLSVRSLGGISLFAWIIVGAAMILLQQFSWHAYHFTMLLWPIGMLAALGAAQIVQGRGPRALLLLLALGVAVNLTRFGYRQWSPLRAEIDVPHYVQGLPALTARLESDPCRTAIVFGSPALMLAAKLVPVGELTGQLAPILLPTQWRRLETTLRERRPAYVYLHAGALALIGSHAPALAGWIEETYRSIATDANRGSWMVPIDGSRANCVGAKDSGANS